MHTTTPLRRGVAALSTAVLLSATAAALAPPTATAETVAKNDRHDKYRTARCGGNDHTRRRSRGLDDEVPWGRSRRRIPDVHSQSQKLQEREVLPIN